MTASNETRQTWIFHRHGPPRNVFRCLPTESDYHLSTFAIPGLCRQERTTARDFGLRGSCFLSPMLEVSPETVRLHYLFIE